MKIFTLALSLLLVGCAINVRLPQPTNAPISLFPKSPGDPVYKSKPVVKKLSNGNFEVTPEMVQRSILLENYYKEIEVWKKDQ